jgi:hypothetical protein
MKQVLKLEIEQPFFYNEAISSICKDGRSTRIHSYEWILPFITLALNQAYKNIKHLEKFAL